MSSILDKIAKQKHHDLKEQKQKQPLESFTNSIPVRDFVGKLQSTRPAVIAEIKKASPSKGVIREDFSVADIAAMYEQHGASCLSVLTEPHFFQGAGEYIATARAHSSLPVLRKDFIVDGYQIHESRHLGADCILLIVALLDDAQLLDYCQMAQELGMAVLVESHTAAEFQRAIQLPTPLIGVNNRSLHSFVTDLNISLQLRPLLPVGKLFITESGINHRADIQTMQAHDIHAFLIGESLMREKHPGDKLRELIS